jgi:PBP1b-binding outer membrane lipoprotein LpoB
MKALISLMFITIFLSGCSNITPRDGIEEPAKPVVKKNLKNATII